MLYRRYIKKILDITLAFIGIVLLSPVFLVLIFCIKLDSKGPVLFKQRRIGKGKAEFSILKFRTMKVDTPKDTPTHLLKDPGRYITRVGKFMRKTSLDELPQIINILKGEMSIIGPRPCLWNQYDLISERDKYGANSIYPGLTGWAQINGRDELPIEIKAKLDGEYVENLSFYFDVRCFLGTIVSILKHDGVIEGGTGEIERLNTKADKTDRVKTNGTERNLG
jgi:O-antigen biosynthesis protein WbqP